MNKLIFTLITLVYGSFAQAQACDGVAFSCNAVKGNLNISGCIQSPEATVEFKGVDNTCYEMNNPGVLTQSDLGAVDAGGLPEMAGVMGIADQKGRQLSFQLKRSDAEIQHLDLFIFDNLDNSYNQARALLVAERRTHFGNPAQAPLEIEMNCAASD